MTDDTIRLTTAQAIIRHLAAQYIEIDGEERRVCGGGFGIFGHGNVTCLGEALYDARDALPLYRGQNEMSMGFAAAAYSKQWLRQRFMFCTASAGPGTSNLLTASALAHANRLPMLMLCGDTFLTRLPDPVLQQLEHYGNPALGLNDAFKAVTRYWDRITHPAQIVQSLPAALATMLDPADCGPAFIAPAAGRPGLGMGLSDIVLRQTRPPHPPPEPRRRRDRRRRRAAVAREAPDDHRRRRRPVFPRDRGTHRLRRGARHSRGRDHRRPRQSALHPSAQHRAGRRHRLQQRQRHRRTRRRDPRRRHPPPGFHHRILDRLRQGRAHHRHERRPPRRRQAHVADGRGRREALARRARLGARGLQGTRRLDEDSPGRTRRLGRLRQKERRPRQPTRLLRPGDRRRERPLPSARPDRDGGGRAPGGGHRQLAHARSRDRRRRIRLLLHGLRDRRRLGREDRPIRARTRPRHDRLRRRRLVSADELRHLFLGAQRQEADHPRARQRRLRGDQQAPEQHRQRELQQPHRRLPDHPEALRRRFRGPCRLDGRDGRDGLEPRRNSARRSNAPRPPTRPT